ncbi:hypothetical protein LEP1GSC172_0787 [Leptospira noguchii]|uniref:Uncharacterized protein n=2 Tax=Leptospira noguchii TaxID=28182 RepID=T0FKJ1_9LEPT|nr:hypothetical protein LEP1GSC172_0787 [Leptospira noguchii]EQA70609.1 hypothetical protein LEP1GSC059_4545 [Leptospira noguchii serovar Panama str. CZ214]
MWELKQIPITKNECLKICNMTESVGLLEITVFRFYSNEG